MNKLLIEDHNSSKILTLNRPDKINAFDSELWGLLGGTLNAFSDDDAVKTVIVKGAGGNFSSGVDLASMMSGNGNDYEKPFENCIDALMNFKKPLIACAEGMAVGGGATILLHFDYVFLSDNFRLKYPFTELGLVPEVGSSFLIYDKLGYQKAFDLLTTSDWIDAHTYCSEGLATKVCKDPLTEAIKCSDLIETKSQGSLIQTKAILKQFQKDQLLLARRLETEAMQKLYGSKDNHEAVKKFFGTK